MQGVNPSVNLYDRDIIEHIRIRLLYFGQETVICLKKAHSLYF